MTVRIREGDLARDRLHYLAFIDGLQEFEHRIEPNRRLDVTVAADHLGVLLDGIAKSTGKISWPRTRRTRSSAGRW